MLPENFDRLLAWLDPDREEAGKTYERIRRKLIHFFGCRGYSDPDALADVSIDRVSSAIARRGFEFTGDRILFFYGVAKKICLEWQRQAARPVPRAADLYVQAEDSLPYQCLESCIGRLTLAHRSMVLAYYQYEAGKKIECRERLAREYGTALNALRIRVHRIRTKLRECIESCIQIGSNSR